MNTFSCRWFEDVEIAFGAVSVSIPVDVGNTLDEVFFYLDEDALDDEWGVNRLLSELEAIALFAHQQIMRTKTTHIVKSFAQIHFDEIELFDKEYENVESALLSLRLRGLAIHAERKDAFSLTLDFGYARALSDEVLAVRFSAEAEFLGIDHES